MSKGIGKQLRIGIIGTGGMGGRHARNLAREVAASRVTGIFEPDTARRDAVAAETGATQLCETADELLAHPDVEAVLVAAPDRFHADLTRACIEVGRGPHAEHARKAPRRAGIDPGDFRVGPGRAHDDGVRLALDVQVVGEPCLPEQVGPVLTPTHRPAGERHARHARPLRTGAEPSAPDLIQR